VEEGCTVQVAICTITGPNGSADVACLVMKPDDADITQIHPMATASSASAAVCGGFEQTAPVRRSTPASVLNHTFDMQRDPSAPCWNLPEAERCVCVAQKAFDDCMADKVAAMAACMLIAAVAGAAAFAKCAAPLIIVPGFNILALGSCATIGMLVYAAACTACLAYFFVSIQGCVNSFRTSMEGCGWNWAET
jgi:hypothetical protein